MPTSTLSSKGQITIPKEIRAELEIDTGDRVLFVIREDGVVELRPETVDIRDLFGLLKSKRKRPVTIEEMDKAIRRKASGL